MQMLPGPGGDEAMTTVTIEIRGIDEIIKRFGDKDYVTRPLAQALDKAAKDIQAAVTKYPPEPPDSTYRRTGTLGRKVTTEVDRGHLEARVGTRLEYAPYVLDDEEQARVHRGRWKTMGEARQERLRNIESYFGEAAREIAKGLAGE